MSSRVVLLSESPPKLYFIKHQRNMYQMAWARVAFQGRILLSLSLWYGAQEEVGAPWPLDLAGREDTGRNVREEAAQGCVGDGEWGLLVSHWWKTGEKAKCFSTISWG